MDNSNLYYENTQKLKRFYAVLTVLFYIGFICGISTIIIYRIIAPSDLLSHYQPNGEDIVITILCAFFAVAFNLIIVKSNNFNQEIIISKNKIEVIIKKQPISFKTSDFENYVVTRNYFFHKEYKLIFTNNKEIFIMSGKNHHITDVFDIFTKN